MIKETKMILMRSVVVLEKIEKELRQQMTKFEISVEELKDL